MEKTTNNFRLFRKLPKKTRGRVTDSVYVNVERELINITIRPSWSHSFKNGFLKNKEQTTITANNILVLNLNHIGAYGHIYSEVFSELCAVDETYPEYDCILMVKSPLMQRIIDTFDLKLSNKIKFIQEEPNKLHLLDFHKLEIVNHCPLSHVNKFKNVANLKSIFHNSKPITNRPKNFLIFCSRRSRSAKHGRNITEENENEIIEYLKRYSTENNLEFYLLTGEGPDGRILSIENQYKLFTNAKIVVGPHGGVMNNLIFLDPAKKPKVIEFYPGGESKSFSRLFGGAIDVFAEYHQIPYILPTEVQEQIADEPNEALRMVKVISMLQKIDCIIDVSELKKILANL
jgi:capsular polysaccharide biosynthesis protein